MSEEAESTIPQDDGSQDDDTRQALLIGAGAAIVLMLLALTVALVLIFALRSDVALLEEQARKSAKTTKALQEELATLKESVNLVAPRRAVRPGNIDAANPASDCVIRPGSRGGVAECMQLAPID